MEEMGETKWNFHETPFFGRWRPRLVGRMRGTEGQDASGPVQPPLRASSCHATGGDVVTRLVPGFMEEMLLIGNLMYKVEYLLTRRLNTILEAKGLGPVDHVMQALNQLKNKFINKKENKALRGVLQRFFKSIGGNISEDVLIAQWATCRDWQCRRVSFAHPLKLANLENVKNKISSDEGFAEGREIALIMVIFAIENTH